MHWIDFASPNSVREAVGLLNDADGKARVLAGGTDLLVQLRGGRFDDVNLVVDGKNIPELNEITYDPEGGLTLGAAVPCYRLYGNATISRQYPGLIDSASLIGGTQIQGRASFGGNLCNATPSADSIPAMIAHSAVANVAGPNGNRQIAVEDFCTGPRQQCAGARRDARLHQLPRANRRLRGELHALHSAQRDGHRRSGRGHVGRAGQWQHQVRARGSGCGRACAAVRYGNQRTP